MMKKVALTAAAVLALGMTAAACGDDDDTPGTDAPSGAAITTPDAGSTMSGSEDSMMTEDSMMSGGDTTMTTG